MAKATKPQRAALDAMDTATQAAKQARRAAKELPKKSANKIRDLADDAIDAADVSKKTLRKRPKKVAAHARKATDRLTSATKAALDKVARKAALRSEAERIKKEAKRAVADRERRKTEAAQAETSAILAQSATAAPRGGVETQLADAETTPHANEPAVPRPATRETAGEKPPTASDLSALTIVQLRQRARDAGKTGFSRLTKAQLVELLT